MNWYALLPLAGLLANLMLALFVFYRFRGERNKVNASFLLVILSIAAWSVSYLVTFMASSPEAVLRFNTVGVLAGQLTTTFMLLFAVYFAEYDWLNRNKFIMPAMLVVPGLVTFLTFTTNWMNIAAHRSYWGFWIERGPLYTFHSSYVILLAVLSVAITLSVYRSKEKHDKRHQAVMYSIAFAFPIVAGVITEFIGPLFHVKLIPLSAVFSTVTVLVLAREMVEHSFLGFTPALVAEKVIGTMGDMLIVLNKERRVAFANRSTAETLGFKPEEMIGLGVKSIIAEIIGKIRIDKLDLLDFETEATTKHRQTIPVSTSGIHITDERDRIIGYVITMRDLRHSQELIGKLEQSRSELLRSTRVRTVQQDNVRKRHETIGVDGRAEENRIRQQMNFLILLPVATFIINCLLAEAILLHYRGSTNRYVIAYTMLTVSLAIWSIGLMMTIVADNPKTALIGDAISGIMVVSSASTLVLFAGYFAEVKVFIKSYLPMYLIGAAVFFFTVLSSMGLLVKEMQQISWGWWPVPATGFWVLSTYAIITTSIAAGIMIRRLIWGYTSRLRLQAAIMVVALILPVAAGSGTDVIMRILGIPTFPMTFLFGTITALLLAYAMLYYRFLDITPKLAANTIADSMVEYLVVTDDDGAIRYANPSAQQAIGKRWNELNRSNIDEHILGATELLIEESVSTHGARAHLIRGGGYAPISCNVTHFSSETFSGKIFAMRDISETEKLIDKLERSNDELQIRETELEHMNRINVEREKEIVETKQLIEEINTGKKN